MVKLFRMLMGVSIMLLLMACVPRAAPAPTPAPAASQAASPLPAPVAPVISAEETGWQKVVAAAKKEGRLTVYSQIVPDAALALTKTFYERTGVAVDIISGEGRAHIERIKVERRVGTMVASVMYGQILQALINKQDGLLQRIGYLPSLADEAAWVQSPKPLEGEGYIIVSARQIQSPWINTKLVKLEEEPPSWRDLLQPQWKGKIDTLDPVIGLSSLGRLYYYFGKQGILDEAYFHQLGQQLTFSINNRESARKVSVGMVPIMLIGASTTIGTFALEGAPVKNIDMEEGLFGLISEPGTLLDRAPHPNAGRLFLNFLWSKEGQILLHKNTGTWSLRKDVPDFSVFSGKLSPKRIIWSTFEGEMEVNKLDRAKTVAKLLKGE